MFCANCGSQIEEGSRFCPSCGKPAGSPACPGCGNAVKPDAAFCPNCGKSLQTSARPETPPPAPLRPRVVNPVPAGIASDLSDLAFGEVVLMDTGTFPVTYVKNAVMSINGKLYLTNKRLVFKGSKLQGEGGFFGGDAASKSRQYFSVPLAEIASTEAGMVTLIVNAREIYKFGAMRKTKDWSAAILAASVRG